MDLSILQMGSVAVSDGAGHASGHFELYQSFLSLKYVRPAHKVSGEHQVPNPGQHGHVLKNLEFHLQDIVHPAPEDMSRLDAFRAQIDPADMGIVRELEALDADVVQLVATPPAA